MRGVGAEHMTIDQCEAIREMDDSQLIGVPATVSADLPAVEVQVRNAAVPEVSTVKRRRGRPPRNQGKAAAPPPPSKAMEEEDVCFICFDGGSLVLCDRRGCPKAYHPACIKRDEAFFQSKAKWNCGWHICSSCEKASHFMCYTCPYSLCKGCTKDADYLCVRGNQGFCRTCMKMIMLIEKVPLGNNEQVQVDFDDILSWEYLFKVYWVSLKESLLLTVDEILKAKNPWQVDELPKTKSPWKVPAVMDTVSESSSELYYARDEKTNSSGNSYGSLETNYSKRRKYDVEPKILTDEKSVGTEKSSVSTAAPLPEGTKWATKELLEFVAHVRNGDTSFLSQVDVQALLLEYIKSNNLRDPRRKLQILCDTRLINLFGKTRVGHIEMLKLLEYHFLVKENLPSDESVRVDIAAAAATAPTPTPSIGNGFVVNNDRRRKTRKRTDEKGTHINPNPDEYAAIDVHNINLLYLKRSSMENLMVDADKFHEKVVGSFVRIRIPCGDHLQDVHRLVQVVGTSKAAQSYKLGTRITDIMLQIMNLDKKEVVSIDGISDQDFSEEECKRLRLSVESGIIKLMRVGEILERAMALHSVKVTDFLEAEISELTHLRDRASEKRQRKNLRICVEKLEILQSVEERQRRLLEVPIVHSDPNIGLGSSRQRQKSHAVAPSVPISAVSSVMCLPQTTGVVSNDEGLWHYRDPFGTVQGPFPMMQLRKWSTSRLFPLDLRVWMMNGKEEESILLTDALLGLFHKEPPLPANNHMPAREVITDSSKKDTIWNSASSQDTNRMPPQEVITDFSDKDVKLNSASSQDNNHMPPQEVISECSDKDTKASSRDNNHMPPQEVITDCSDKDTKWNSASSQDTSTAHMDKNTVDQNGSSEKNDSSSMDAGNDEITRSKELGSRSSRLTMLVDLVIGSNELDQKSEQPHELSKTDKSHVSQSQICDTVASPSPSASAKVCDAETRHVAQVDEEENRSTSVNDVKRSPPKPTPKEQTVVEDGDEKKGKSEGCSSQSSGQSWHSTHMNISYGWDLNSTFPSMVNSNGTVKIEQDVNFPEIGSSLPEQSNEDPKGLSGESKHSVSCNVPIIDAGPSWSTTSSLVAAARLPDMAAEWARYSSAAAKPSVEDWGSNLVSASSLRPPNGSSNPATIPTSGAGELRHTSPPHQSIDTTGWQAMVSEPNEFSLVDESVSDLLAEVEAMESLGGLPSPTSKLSCVGDLMHVSDNDCFSPVEDFSTAPVHGRSDALSSTGGLQIPCRLSVAEEQLGLSIMPSQPIAPRESLEKTQKPPQMTVTEPFHMSLMLSQPIVTSKPQTVTNPTPHRPFQPEHPIGITRTDVRDARKASNGYSSNEVERPHNVTANLWEGSSETQSHQLSLRQTKLDLDIQLPSTSNMTRQVEPRLDVQFPGPASVDLRLGNSRGRSILGTAPGVTAQGNNPPPHTHSGSPSLLGSQPRHGGGDKHSGSREHRSNHQSSRDSGYGRERSSTFGSSRQSSSHGGSSFKAPPKGPRVCKFYENGHCRKGASCSFWHPS
ncbi:Zinc finger CCCH domain-containing protein 44 [Linum perenne]